ncbi:hypothetical protein LTR95_018339, partial [Oleoguttula sp. CCFEE 5521]
MPVAGQVALGWDSTRRDSHASSTATPDVAWSGSQYTSSSGIVEGNSGTHPHMADSTALFEYGDWLEEWPGGPVPSDVNCDAVAQSVPFLTWMARTPKEPRYSDLAPAGSTGSSEYARSVNPDIRGSFSFSSSDALPLQSRRSCLHTTFFPTEQSLLSLPSLFDEHAGSETLEAGTFGVNYASQYSAFAPHVTENGQCRGYCCAGQMPTAPLPDALPAHAGVLQPYSQRQILPKVWKPRMRADLESDATDVHGEASFGSAFDLLKPGTAMDSRDSSSHAQGCARGPEVSHDSAVSLSDWPPAGGTSQGSAARKKRKL